MRFGFFKLFATWRLLRFTDQSQLFPNKQSTLPLQSQFFYDKLADKLETIVLGLAILDSSQVRGVQIGDLRYLDIHFFYRGQLQDSAEIRNNTR